MVYDLREYPMLIYQARKFLKCFNNTVFLIGNVIDYLPKLAKHSDVFQDLHYVRSAVSLYGDRDPLSLSFIVI